MAKNAWEIKEKPVISGLDGDSVFILKMVAKEGKCRHLKAFKGIFRVSRGIAERAR